MSFMVNSLKKEKNKLEILNELILDTSYTQNESDLFNILLKKTTSIIGADFGYIVSLMNERDDVDIIGKYNLPYGYIEDINKLEIKKTQVLQKSNKSIVIIGFSDINNSATKYLATKYNLKTVIKLPIKGKHNDFSAMMTFCSHKNPGHFDRHKTFLETLANTIDILLRKQQENEKYQSKLIRIEKLRALGELAGGVVHDFNNLLSAILGISQIALSKELDDEIKQYFEVINRAALDGKGIVDRIQGFNKSYSFKSKEAFLINSLIQSCIDIVKHRWKNDYERNGIKLEITTEFESQSKIYCSEHEIREVFINIIMNAMDAMDRGGTLTIRTYDNDDKVIIEIQDTGDGISEDIKDRIFEPFFSTKNTKGTGLGLSIVNNIVKSHGGKIDVDSKIGYGTKFVVSFDRYSNEVTTEVRGEDFKEDIAFDGLKVLIVDDNYYVADIFSKMLELFNVEAEIETNSMKVIDKLSVEKYDIIFCDLAMPQLNGKEVAMKVKKLYPDLGFILITGWTNNSDVDNDKNIDYVLKKPCTIDELAIAIKYIIKSKEVLIAE